MEEIDKIVKKHEEEEKKRLKQEEKAKSYAAAYKQIKDDIDTSVIEHLSESLKDSTDNTEVKVILSKEDITDPVMKSLQPDFMSSTLLVGALGLKMIKEGYDKAISIDPIEVVADSKEMYDAFKYKNETKIKSIKKKPDNKVLEKSESSYKKVEKQVKVKSDNSWEKFKKAKQEKREKEKREKEKEK